MKRRQLPVRGACDVAGGLLFGLVVGFPLSANAQRELVYMQGVGATMPADGGAGAQALRDEVCSEEILVRAASALDARVQPQLESLGVDPRAIDDAANAAFEAYSTLCEDTTPVKIGAFRIIYAECRMTMHEGQATLDLRIPPGQGSAIFDLIDYEGQQVVRQPIDIAPILSEQVASGSASRDISGPGPARPYDMDNLSTTVREYTFRNSFEMPMAAMLSFGNAGVTPEQIEMLDQFMGLPVITTEGTAWMANDVAGLETVRAFYENFSAVIESGQGAGSLMGGLFNHFLLSEGLPLEIEQTTEMTMGSIAAGLPGQLGASMFPMPGAETTHTLINSVLVLPMSEGYCESSLIPDGFAVIGPPSELSSTDAPGAGSGSASSQGTASAAPGQGAVPSGSPAGSQAAAGSAEMAAAMAEANAAMANMTPEERAAMQQAMGGFGALLGGALSGQGFPGAAPGAAPGAPPPSARTRPSSADLASDNLTQMVQNYLQALGYDPGNTDGEPSVQTTIAISQFQAEKGLEVTGEITPQLAGILAAEVDQ